MKQYTKEVGLNIYVQTVLVPPKIKTFPYLTNSASMQQASNKRRDSRGSSKIVAALNRVQQLRQSLSSTFRKSRTANIEIVPSPFLNRKDHWQGLITPTLQRLSFSEEPFAHLELLSSESIGLSAPTDSSASSNPQSAMDGAAERMFRRSQMSQSHSPGISAIFVHAGAGYHSVANEHVHLGACDSAARMAMRILKSGGTAVDAVEAAIKVLEDKEITNAGYGSNLAIDGVVECDATIVDHLGRSGACGAVAQIKNPINLARAILEASSKPLSLRRVPPNLLVGQGATDFAWEQGIPVVPHEVLVSRSARERYVRWREDLKRAEGIERAGSGRLTPKSTSSSQGGEDLNSEYESRVQAKQRRDHTNAILTGTWNEGQPDSPQPSPLPTPSREDVSPSLRSPSPGLFIPGSRVRAPSPNNASAKRPRYANLSEQGRSHSLLGPNSSGSDVPKSPPNVAMTMAEGGFSGHIRPGTDGQASPTTEHESFEAGITRAFGQEGNSGYPSGSNFGDDDFITDTVGAIAIDMYGNIASGSSSGGIGMKHRGRVGPAALVGIGSAVIPADENDIDQISVAAVTSGTGEHMATTLASQKCCERLYQNTKRAQGGADIEATEEEAIESFVQEDFMGHPGVRGSNSTGALGVMAVKKTPYGYFLHFAHNTDSFALTSMHSNERDSKCVMSRLGSGGRCVRGGRKIRVD